MKNSSIFFSTSSCVAFLILLPFAASVSFQKARFDPNDPEMVYQGDAVPKSAGAIELNRVDLFIRVGWATYAGKVRIWDSESGKLSDFSTRFSFIVDTLDRAAFGDGFSFFLAPVHSQIIPNSAGAFLGLFNSTTSSYSTQNQIVSVEFDSVVNSEFDPQYHHVGINVNSLTSSVTVPWNASLHSGDTGEARIDYNATTKNLTASWGYKATSSPGERNSISYQIDLSEVLPELVMVGFSGATGSAAERHVIESWDFSSSLDVRETKGNRLILIIGLSVSGFVLIIGIAVVVFLVYQRRSKTTKKEAEEKIMNLTSINDDLERGAGPRRFLRRDIVSATNNFSNDRKLGEGGFGAVYRGYLFGKKSPLSWAVRYRVALGLASALLYLHEEWEQCVIHRDIKASNIMLDSSFNVKLGDFGLARLMDHELGPQTTGVAGTFGYLAPEYVSTGRASKESDVFSFGIVALEIATGRKSVDPIETSSEVSLVEWIWDLYGEEKLHLARSQHAAFNKASNASSWF